MSFSALKEELSLYVILGEKIAVKKKGLRLVASWIIYFKKAPFANDLVHSGYQFVLHRRHQACEA